MKFSPGDIALMELGMFIENASVTRLVKVRVEALSQDGLKALVKLLPPDPQKKDTIYAERYNVGKTRILKTKDLYRDANDIKESCEFRAGDVVMWCAFSEPEVATVLKVQKKSARILSSDGVTFTAKFEHLMVISRPSNEVDPGDTESKCNG